MRRGQGPAQLASNSEYYDVLNSAYHYLDLVPKGRDEHGRNRFWVRCHDEYAGASVAPAGGSG